MDKNYTKNVYEGYWKQLNNFIINNLHKFNLEDMYNTLNFWDLLSPEKFRNNDEAKNITIPIFKDNIYKNITLYDASIEKKTFIYDVLSSQIDDNTDVIIELGAGWGRNIFALYMNKNIKNIDLIMSEVTTSGREICSTISNYFEVPIITTYFNYYDWIELIELIKNKKYKNICVFSSYSIEQITFLDKKLFEDFLNIEDVLSLKFTHIEPIGFQLHGNPQFTGKPEYNQNLISILNEFSQQNKIKITKSIPDYFSIGGMNMCASIIQWEKQNQY